MAEGERPKLNPIIRPLTVEPDSTLAKTSGPALFLRSATKIGYPSHLALTLPAAQDSSLAAIPS